MVEPHLDALAILWQAGDAGRQGAWGVFAAEGGEPLRATPSRWRGLTGRKPWCSLAGGLDHALVSARVGDERQLFVVDLGARRREAVAAPGWLAAWSHVTPDRSTSTGCRPRRSAIRGGTSNARASPGAASASPLSGTAAPSASRDDCWRPRPREPDQIALMHLGAVDVALHAARCVLGRRPRSSTPAVSTGPDGCPPRCGCGRSSPTAAEDVLRRAAHGLGPGPLATDEDHAATGRRPELYLRQWHAERDEAALGRVLVRPGAGAW